MSRRLLKIGGAPKGYDAQAFARDFAVFQAWAKANAPEMRIEGPGGVGEGTPLAPPFMHLLTSEGILKATGPAFEIFTLPLVRCCLAALRCDGAAAVGTTRTRRFRRIGSRAEQALRPSTPRCATVTSRVIPSGTAKPVKLPAEVTAGPQRFLTRFAI